MIRSVVLQLLGEQYLRLTPTDLVREVRRHTGITKRSHIQAILSQMVADGDIIYSQHCATTHFQIGLDRTFFENARSASKMSLDDSGEIPAHHRLQIEAGISFGSGEHPTTLLSLQGLDLVLNKLSQLKSLNLIRALDIGTGSGILAIAAAVLGVGWNIGLEIDPVACREAARNAELNNVGRQVAVVAGTIACVGACVFETLLANLRPPTLVSLVPRMKALLADRGYWILSGFRPDEVSAVERAYPSGMTTQCLLQNRGWSALVVRQES